MGNKKVLIVGGGIGGLSAATAIRQFGFDVKVIEKQPDLHSSVWGVGIIQPMNALRALDAIGCADACIEVGFAAPAWASMYDVDGNLMREMSGTRIAGADYPPMNGVTRPHLHRILTERALEVGVTIEYSTMFVELLQDETGVDVSYDDERTERYDLVVGADGVRSQVRNYVLEADLKPKYIGQSAYRVNIPRLPEIDRIILQDGPNGMAGYVPIGPDLAYLFFNAAMERSERPPQEELANELKRLMEPYGGLTARVRDEYINDPDDVVLRPEEAMIAPAPWHRGRIVLMGDAVHAITPHLGQGAAQAIEDGVVLAECLEKHDDLQDAFAEYTERRYERCKLIVETSMAIGQWETGNLPDFDNVAATNHVLQVMASPI
jgi:2-polyprenyl-6-methoxyphenol hydroxylase-like FAD-dependent oxidoreductase